ncbi:MAG: hypothetical protein RJA99_4287 [Pseudomonadota bacterium]|jgi:hypothetical protein
MTAQTLQQLRDRLTLYLEAEAKILSGQSYQLGDRRMQRADLSEVRQQIDVLSSQIARLESAAGSTRGRMRFGLPG